MKKILFVEDEAMFRIPVVKFLRRKDYHVVEASSGDAALKELDEFTPDILITNANMPGIVDGPELIRRAKAKNPNIYAILVSGLGENLRVECGADATLGKPYSIFRLHEILQKIP